MATKYNMLIEILVTTLGEHYKPTDRNDDVLKVVKHLKECMAYDEGCGFNPPPDKTWLQADCNNKKLNQIIKDLEGAQKHHEETWEPEY